MQGKELSSMNSRQAYVWNGAESWLFKGTDPK